MAKARTNNKINEQMPKYKVR